MTNLVSFFLNGEPHHRSVPTTLADLIKEIGLENKRIAVEKNGELIPKALFSTTYLAPNDRIEIVVAVSGG